MTIQRSEERKASKAQKKEVETRDRQEDLSAVREGTPAPSGQALDEEMEERSIRVLLMDSDYGSYFHESAAFTCQGKDYVYTTKSPELFEGELIFQGGQEGIALSSLVRQENPPVYQGVLKIRAEEEGLVLINELPLEEYLKSVVPGEMPASYEKEALKAQAVCARTYALSQMLDGKLEDYGADVDDSVRYQVYQNIGPKEETSVAVEETRGLVMAQEGKPIQAYYFSTSSGMTSTDEVWGADAAASYLKSVPCAFDKEASWSRWRTELPWDMVKARSEALHGTGGDLIALEVVKKSQSQAALELNVVTELGTAAVLGEYSIRQFLAPSGQAVLGKDGAKSSGGNLLPSAYFDMEVFPGERVCLEGRGYGHGVGMSQTAADQMAKEGYTFQEILNYFFRDVTLTPVSQLMKEE